MAFCFLGSFSFNSLQAQLVIMSSKNPLNKINGTIIWDNSKCTTTEGAGLHISSMVYRRSSANRVYNLDISVYELGYPATTVKIAGPKISFGDSTATSQAFSVTDIPTQYTSVILVFSSGYQKLYKYYTTISPASSDIKYLKVNSGNKNNAVFEINCFARDDANGNYILN